MAADLSILRNFAKKSPNAKCSVKVFNDNGTTTTLKLVGGDAYSRREVEQLIAGQVGIKKQTKGTDEHEKGEDNLNNSDLLPPEVALAYYTSAFPTATKKGNGTKE